MKKLFTILICSAGLSVAALAQGPGAVPASASPPATVAPLTAASPSISSPASESEDDSSTLAGKIHKKISKNLHNKGIHFDVNSDSDSGETSGRDHHNDDIPALVVPIIMVVFGTPILIVAVILYFGFSRSRMMHRTVRMMVEKGQPVPAALLNPPPSVRKRSDMRRGVILVMFGAGLMGFLAAVNDGEGGSWALGLIPFLIGAGYLLVWKLEGKSADEAKADNPPPLP